MTTWAKSPVNALGPDRGGLFEVEALENWPAPGSLRILRADPEILISDALLDEFRTRRGHPDVTFGDHILTIRGVNRTVSYGLVRFNEQWREWLAVLSLEPLAEGN